MTSEVGEKAENDRDSSPELKALLGRAYERVPMPERSLLPSIQERLYVHTRGRYFKRKSDGLSGRTTLLLGLAMLLLILALIGFVGLEPLLK
jgi:hypothetical protein